MGWSYGIAFKIENLPLGEKEIVFIENNDENDLGWTSK